MEKAMLRSLTFEMDSSLGEVVSIVETLEDVEVLFSQFVDDLNLCLEKGDGDFKTYYRLEYQRKARVYTELMNYTVNHLNKAIEDVHKLHNEMYKQIVKVKELEDPNEIRLAN